MIAQQVNLTCATDWADASDGRAQRPSRLRTDACCDKVMWRVLLKKLVGAVKWACREATIWGVEFPLKPSLVIQHCLVACCASKQVAPKQFETLSTRFYT